MSALARLSFVAAVFGVGLLAGACFEDIPTATDRVCPGGQATCACLAGDVCDAGLSCDAGVCRSLRCEAGVVGCECGPSGACFDNASCIDGSCILVDDSPAEPDADSVAEVGGAEEASDVDGGVGSTGGMGSGDPDPTTGDGAESGDVPANACGCGWIDEADYWECSATPQPNAEGSFGLCPPVMNVLYERWLEGETDIRCALPDDATMTTIDFSGCCLGGLASVFCDESTDSLVFTTCAGSVFCEP